MGTTEQRARECHRMEAIRHLVTAATALANFPDANNVAAAMMHAGMAMISMAKLAPDGADLALDWCRKVQSGEMELSL